MKRQVEALPEHGLGDEPDSAPGAKPCVQGAEGGRGGAQLEAGEAEGGEEKGTPVTHVVVLGSDR